MHNARKMTKKIEMLKLNSDNVMQVGKISQTGPDENPMHTKFDGNETEISNVKLISM
jgi:hypothetical protein